MKDDNEPKELTTENWQKNLSSTGQWTEMMGWAFFVVTPIYLLILNKSHLYNVVLWVFSLFAGLYYIYSGRYIRYKRGRHTSKFLAFNGVITVFFVGGVISIVVFFKSWASLIWYRKFNKKLRIKQIGATKAPITNVQKIAFVVLVVVGLATVVYLNSKPLTGAKEKAVVDSLTAQYNECSSSLTSRQASVDTTDQTEVDSYNNDLANCEAIRVKQNAAVDSYNKLRSNQL